jgi:serine/threonine-protein kinase
VRLVARTIASRYALGARLGAGGMGDVFSAEDFRLHREVAIKLVPASEITAVARGRFIREAQSAARISHPNAVTVYDAGESDGYLYLVMERVTGETLDKRLAATGPMSVNEAATVATAVLGALGAAHNAGVVHRDVKPANIVVGPAGVKLVDFGIATLLDDVGNRLTAAGELVGTPKYLAPEQIVGQPATPASDLYSVGIVLFEMLAGFAPFDRGSPVATAIAHRDEEAIDVREVRTDVPARVAVVIGTALCKLPADRYHTAAEMQRALAPAVADDYAGDTVVMSPPSVGPAPTSTTRAGWWIAAVAAVAIGATVAALVVANGDDDPEGLPTSTAEPTSTAITSTTTAPTTTAPTTTVAATSAAAIASPAATVDELIALMSTDPSRYGPRTAEVIERLDGIDNRGRKSRDRAATLLDDAAVWAHAGELTPEAIALLDPVLSSLADQGGGNDDEDEDNDD